MFWFAAAFIIAPFVSALSSKGKKIDRFFETLFIGSIIAIIANILVWGFYNGTYDKVNAEITSSVVTKNVNGESSFVFTAGGSEYVYPVNDVTVKVGQPRLVVKNTAALSRWYTLFTTKDYVSNVIMTIRPS